MRLESYAQEFEDIIVYSFLRDVDDGFYIDVGANDPTNISVTKFFYLRGWHGINIEPLPFRCLQLEEQRPRDINLCIGVGAEKGSGKLFESDALSTFSNEVAAKWTNTGGGRETPVLTLTEVFHRYCNPHQPIHFCKIDVEGFEREVLLGIKDWNEFRPWMFVMEATLPETRIPCHDKWENILFENDYIFAFQNGINRYYVDKYKAHLLQRAAEVRDFFRRHEIAVMRMQIVNIQ